MFDKGLKLYLKEASSFQKEYTKELDSLRADLLAENFSKRDFLAVERLLQVYTEMSIGLAKHCLKKLGVETQTDAYLSFSKLRENNFITGNELIKWRKIIGMRNGLVHDYLNIDLTIVESIIRNQNYNDLGAFCKKAIAFLES